MTEQDTHLGVQAMAEYLGTAKSNVSRMVKNGGLKPDAKVNGVPYWSIEYAATIKAKWDEMTVLRRFFYGE